MMMLRKILRFERRQLHTIISREMIKPSSPTPSHLHTYNLGELDQRAPQTYIPLILFYPNNRCHSLTADDKARELKKSLSQNLTQYYPFAGRLHTPTTPYVDCNDEGVVFVEAKHDIQLDKFQRISEDDDTSVGQLFPDGMVWEKSPRYTSLVGVQLNHFACGGIAVAVSMSHKIGDGCTLGSYVAHWASVARYGSTDHNEVLPINPHFIHSPPTTIYPFPESSGSDQTHSNYVTRNFVFPNSKLNDLKNKVLAEGGSTLSINKPTRVEVVTSIIYKTAVSAATTIRGSLNPYSLVIPVDIRNQCVPKLPQITVGNLISFMMVTSEKASLSGLVTEIKKEKMNIKRVESMQQTSQHLQLFLSRLGNECLGSEVGKRPFWCTSLCGLPYNNVDFGWGKASDFAIMLGSGDKICCVLMDTRDGDGIQARVALEKEDMEVFEKDKEMLSFCQD